MKFVPTALLLISLALIANAKVLSVFKRSVTDQNMNMLSVQKAMKTLNTTILKYFKQIQDDLRMGFLDCEEDFHSIVKRSVETDQDVLSIENMMRSLNTTLENMFKKFDDCLLKRSLKCKDIKEPRNCADVLNKCGGKRSDVYKINPDGKGAFKVYCDQQTDGGGWTVIQRRQDGSVNFYRGWDDYKNGFGDLKGEFWLGLDKIYRLTNKTQKALRIDLEDHEGNKKYTEYDYFAVADEANKYRLKIRNPTGTAGDSLSYHRGQAFTTYDRDNDRRGDEKCAISGDENCAISGDANCAIRREGAWWFKNCMVSHLNGAYHQTPASLYARGINWYCWKGDYYSLKKADMKLRPTEIGIEKKTNDSYIRQCKIIWGSIPSDPVPRPIIPWG